MRAAALALLVLLAPGCARLVGIEGYTPAGDGGGGGGGDGAPSGPLAPPATRSPWNGFYTGSVNASSSLRPQLRWAASAGATHYEVALDKTCEVASMQTCPFDNAMTVTSTTTSVRPSDPLPVATAKPVGARYFWRVRACDDATCGDWSDVRYLNVGRLVDDVDGDGYSDVAVGTDLLNDVYVYQGSAGGLPPGTPPSGFPAAAQFPVGSTITFFGGTVVAGDFNGDGFADVAVSGADSGTLGNMAGHVFVLPGATLGLSSEFTPQIDGPPNSANTFGERMFGPGDLDGDGYDDLVVDNFGELFAYLGGPNGLATTPVTITAPTLSGNRDGHAAIGDVDGDGLPDFAIADGSNVNVLVFHGHPGTAAAMATAPVTVPGAAAVGAITGGLLDGDELSDLVVAGQDGSGNPFVAGFRGGAGGVAPTPYAVTAGGADSGNSAEVVYDDTTPFVFVGGIESVQELDGNLAVQGVLQDVQTGNNFGQELGACDCNGDGRPDVLIAATRARVTSDQVGIVYVHMGLAASPSDELFVSTTQDQCEFGETITR